jgi:membrane-associated HD superfamily phosphohydrolase
MAKRQDKIHCSVHVFSGTRDIFGHNCCNRATVRLKGVAYCAIHAPEAVARRRDARDKKWKAEWAAQTNFLNRERAAYKALDVKLPAALKRIAELKKQVKQLTRGGQA